MNYNWRLTGRPADPNVVRPGQVDLAKPGCHGRQCARKATTVIRTELPYGYLELRWCAEHAAIAEHNANVRRRRDRKRSRRLATA